MWRTDKFTDNQDSDQSISEEEELDYALPDDCISLGGSTEKKVRCHFIIGGRVGLQFNSSSNPEGGLQVLSQLEALRDAHELDHAIEPTISSQKRQVGICIQDVVEFPVFNNEGAFVHFPRRASACNSDDEIISDDEKVSLPSLRSTRNNKACTKSEATRETESLAHLIENAGTSSSSAVFLKANRSFKAAGGRGRAKSTFSFHFQPQKDLSLAVKNKDETHLLSKVLSLHGNLEPIENRAVEHSMSELLELFQGEKIEHSEIDSVPAEVAVGHDHAKPSVAELLDCFRENNVLLGGNSITHSRTKGERAQLVIKRNICPLGDRNIDEDGSCEAFDSGPSSGDEDDHKNIRHTIPESKQKTMTDQFQEAFGISSKNDEGLLFPLPRHSGIGLFGKLQREMQSEKEREMEFLRWLHTEASLTDGGSCIDVRILSKCLEAKLTVCCCSFIRDEEGSQCVDNSQIRKEMGRNSTIIFSPRTCSDVELEAGKLIRVHPPWKEIRVTGKDEKIILSTYFSQILS